MAWSLRRRGKTEWGIRDTIALPVEAGGLGIDLSQQSIHNTLVRVERKLHKEFSADAQAIKARQTEQLAYLQEQAMEGWERSKTDAVATKTKRLGVRAKDAPPPPLAPPPIIDVPGMFINEDGEEPSDEERRRLLLALGLDLTAPDLPVVEQTMDVKGQAGDPRFLSEARNAMADVRKIWGLDAPQLKPADAPTGLLGEDGEALGHLQYRDVVVEVRMRADAPPRVMSDADAEPAYDDPDPYEPDAASESEDAGD